MTTVSHTILLIEDDPIAARFVRDAVSRPDPAAVAIGEPFELVHAEQLAPALLRLEQGQVDVVLLDLSLPDSDGLETLTRLRQHSRDVPVVVLTGTDDEPIGVRALQAGAQDYLVKERIDYEVVHRSIRYAIERRRLEAALQQASLVDELTGLYNRRGFRAHAERAVKLAQRKHRGLLVGCVDVDGLKGIKDAFGHAEGDRAIVAAAHIMRDAFRTSDIVARLGGDELVFLLIEATADAADTVLERLQARLDAWNTAHGAQWSLSFSVGLSGTAGELTPALDELMAEANEALYAKQREQRSRALP
ncbi:MAG: diguanylate cyclase [Gemmatimonadota bacterium]|nr:diguanylate cyclase [Gemmatimonadota bacterium]